MIFVAFLEFRAFCEALDAVNTDEPFFASHCAHLCFLTEEPGPARTLTQSLWDFYRTMIHAALNTLRVDDMPKCPLSTATDSRSRRELDQADILTIRNAILPVRELEAV